ncbi:unnamed protein product [Acanthoscelides obtectus]|uniref:Uncharacterized protein n=1 Tax=Acanthoscelides obtectus TaxID=200917 RepID=A0A9P0P1L5_ACAOB|nr:unnamed protein product [Acanthoscelides obtectus]CAK1629145.1 hypothetical protein AOBTE_LOCUS5600 [Acanthoscelides obtectus]
MKSKPEYVTVSNSIICRLRVALLEFTLVLMGIHYRSGNASQHVLCIPLRTAVTLPPIHLTISWSVSAPRHRYHKPYTTEWSNRAIDAGAAARPFHKGQKPSTVTAARAYRCTHHKLALTTDEIQLEPRPRGSQCAGCTATKSEDLAENSFS